MLSKWRKKARARRLRRAIQAASNEHGLPFGLIASIIFKESRGSYTARRYEPNFYLNYIVGKPKKFLSGHWPKDLSEDTERMERAVSWGCMQVMGQVAREFGFDGDFSELLKPKPAIEFGMRKLVQCWKKETSTRAAIACYNGDPRKPAPQRYAADVLRIMSTKQYEELFK
ncbi:MAG: transglycosylase SLT domain-containing protein [Candidatus Latescibacteria bacterium]|nr:transglycosylase SLT domain-containing protein [Candidatus Latescibacterota bacterium]NIO78068.1 transglycosylase SLT domain-containing protein [Candidatus Latescibacterota bacterium]